MPRVFVFTLSFILSITIANGQTQNRTPSYRQFFFNPYLFNPAFAGINNQSELSIVYSQQWVDFKDAPVIAGINFQHATTGRVALGFSLISDKQVLVRSSSFMATFGYALPLGNNQSLRFGLSGGIGLNTLDLNANEINSNDPALANAANSNFYVDGNIGLVYTLSGFRLGFALTNIFKPNYFSEETFNQFSFSNLKNRLYSMSYRFNVGLMENFAVEPTILYRQSADGLQDAWEASSILYYKNKIWTGAGYNQNKGLTIFLGMNIKKRVQFSYSYEFPPFRSGVTSTSAHELQLNLKLSKKKSNPTSKATLAKTSPPQLASEEEPNVEEEDSIESKVEVEPIVKESPTRPATLEKPTPQGTKQQSVLKPSKGKPAKSFTVSRGHYVVVGVFSMLEHSTKFTQQLVRGGYNANVTLNPKNNLYYVYIFSTYDLEEARKVRSQYRWKNLFKEAWVFTME